MVTSTPPAGPPSTTLTVATAARADSTLATWRVGQILSATVESAPQPGHAALRIGNLQVAAQTGQLHLTPGQTLRLEVASLKAQPILKLLGLPWTADPIGPALRDALPRQQPLAPLLNALARLSTAGSPPPFNAEASRLARALLAQLPDPASVGQAPGLRQALRDSGLFLETKLAQAARAPGAGAAAPGARAATAPGAELARDFKTGLLRLVQALRAGGASSAPAAGKGAPGPGGTPLAAAPGAALAAAPLSAALAASLGRPLPGAVADPTAPLQRGQPPQPPIAAQLARAEAQALTRGELLRQVEGVLARVQLNQLASLPQERAQPPEWLFELPVRREGETDVWALRISRDPEREDGREAPREGEGGPGWTVMLGFDLPGLGPLQARISLHGERIAAQFFSREAGILPRLAEQLPVLEARLRHVGLAVGELSCHHGQIPAAA
ncbi:MAG: flagellar hook-length control protein FliK, partial [Gammaproteobacteria bacterium]